MPKREKKPKTAPAHGDAWIKDAGVVVEQPITDTLQLNYMPYAMSVIISRALPEIDGFKPSHRKLLYTMYKMGLLTGPRTKSANVVGQTMRLNPHGDQAIYDTMVRLTRGNEALLHPYVDSKGNFGKAYSRDMACAASRYTEVKLEKIAAELFRDIDKDNRRHGPQLRQHDDRAVPLPRPPFRRCWSTPTSASPFRWPVPSVPSTFRRSARRPSPSCGTRTPI